MIAEVLHPGSVFAGRYRVIRRLGHGGMGAVYLASCEGLAGFEKLVALKVAHPHVSEDREDMDLFLAEARLTALLQHANLGQVYDLGESRGVYFIAMEYVRGVDLRALMTACAHHDARLPLPVAIAVVCRLLEGLDYAHAVRDRSGRRLHLVHRDISPVNVLLSYTGDVKLIDFGIAKAAMARRKTRTGFVRGKLDYMSPEQCRGLPLDRRSDLFAMGVVLYELLVGHRPFWSENDLELMQLIAASRFTPPRELDPDVPPELEAVVARALAVNPDDRYDAAGDMLAPLEEWMAQSQLRIGARELAAFVNELCPAPDAGDAVPTGEAAIVTRAAPQVNELSEVETRLKPSPLATHTALATRVPHTETGEIPVVLPRRRKKLSGSRPPSPRGDEDRVVTAPATAVAPRPRARTRVMPLIAMAVAAGLLSGVGFFALTRLAGVKPAPAANERHDRP